jgi:RNA polymerase sigma-70 factor, ECF subfamily
MLTQDATWSMPPYPDWFRGHDGIREFLIRGPLNERWKHCPARANGQLAVGCYLFDDASGGYRGAVIDVLTLAGEKISAVTGFHTEWPLPGVRAGSWAAGADLFARFALPGTWPGPS